MAPRRAAPPRERARTGRRLLRRFGHKLYGRAALASSTARAPLLDDVPPYQTGGDMVQVGEARERELRGVAVEVRGGHCERRRRRGLGRSARFSRRLGPRRRRGARSRAPRAGAWEARGSAARAPARPRGRVRQLARVRRRGRAPPRPGDGPRPGSVAIRAGHLCAQPALRALGSPRRRGRRSGFSTPRPTWTRSRPLWERLAKRFVDAQDLSSSTSSCSGRHLDRRGRGTAGRSSRRW
jgi:hypothetical protein